MFRICRLNFRNEISISTHIFLDTKRVCSCSSLNSAEDQCSGKSLVGAHLQMQQTLDMCVSICVFTSGKLFVTVVFMAHADSKICGHTKMLQ